jgi:gamma-glutamyltranspeptidase/glutathione hydrolase
MHSCDHGSRPLDAVLRFAPESAETGRPLPRVAVTDPRSPSTSALRPITAATGSPPTVQFLPAAPDFDARRFSPRPTADCLCAARGPSREAQTCAALPVRPTGIVVEVNHRYLRCPEGTLPSPGPLTGTDLAGGADGHGRDGTLESTGPVRAAPGAGRRWTTSPGPWVLPRQTAGAPRKPPGSARRGHRLPPRRLRDTRYVPRARCTRRTGRARPRPGRSASPTSSTRTARRGVSLSRAAAAPRRA